MRARQILNEWFKLGGRRVPAAWSYPLNMLEVKPTKTTEVEINGEKAEQLSVVRW